MANATKCDICGNFYENKCQEKTMQMHVYDKKDTVYDDYTRAADYTSIDCCPSCTERILGFANVMKSSNR